MAVATIYIDGEIYPENYIWPEETATSLIRVRRQIEAAGEFDSIKLMIFSPGGYCVEGWAIYDYLLSLGKPIETVAYGQCASIATVFFLMGQVRKISPNCEFMAHLPWGCAWGNQYEIQDYLDGLITESNKLIAFYNQQTGMSEEQLAQNMLKDWYMSAQQAVDNGFATEIFQPGAGVLAHAGNRQNRKPVFVMDLKDKKPYKLEVPASSQPLNQKQLMSNVKQGLSKLFAGIQAALNGADFQNLDLTTADGTTLTIETAGDTIAVGDTVSVGGSPAADGDYTLTDGRTITVTGGVITAIMEASTDEATEEQASADDVETVTIPKSEYDQLTANVAAMSEKFEKLQNRVSTVLGTLESKDVTVTAQSGKTPDTTVKNTGQKPADDVVARREARLAKQKKEV